MTLATAAQPPAPASGDDRLIRRAGYAIVIGVFGVLGLWSAFAPLDSAAVAPGVVTVDNYRKTVQHLEGGIVRAIHVRDGQQVQKGDVLVELNDKQFNAKLEVVRGQHIALLDLHARLQAEQAGESAVRYPDALADLRDPRVVEAGAVQDEGFLARRRTYEGVVSVLQKRIGQLRSQIAGLQSVVASKRELVDSYEHEIGDLRQLLAEGYADKQTLREFQRNVEDLKGDIAAGQAEIAASEMQVGETQLQILQVRKEFHADVTRELSDVQAKLFDLEERIGAARDRLERSVVKAPVSGTVMGLSANAIGGVLAPGSPILEIVPEEEELIVEARLRPVDVDRVRAGLPADVRFSAFNRSTTPVVPAKVLTISADRLVDEKAGEAYYLARVQITDAGLNELEELELVPGMPAEVMINTGSRSVLAYLVQPVSNAFARSLRED